MVLFFTTTLCLAIVGLISLIALKRWELSTGAVTLARIRPGLGDVSRAALSWVERTLPTLVKVWSAHTVRSAQEHLQRTLAQLILSVEHMLEKSLHTLRYTTEHKPSGVQASAFLREVAEHKKQLQSGHIFDTISNE